MACYGFKLEPGKGKNPTGPHGVDTAEARPRAHTHRRERAEPGGGGGDTLAFRKVNCENSNREDRKSKKPRRAAP